MENVYRTKGKRWRDRRELGVIFIVKMGSHVAFAKVNLFLIKNKKDEWVLLRKKNKNNN